MILHSPRAQSAGGLFFACKPQKKAHVRREDVNPSYEPG